MICGTKESSFDVRLSWLYLMSVAFSMIYVPCSCNEHGCKAFLGNLATIYFILFFYIFFLALLMTLQSYPWHERKCSLETYCSGLVSVQRHTSSAHQVLIEKVLHEFPMTSPTTCCGSFVAVSFSSMTQFVVVRLGNWMQVTCCDIRGR